VLVQVRCKNARHLFGDVPADAALLFGHTAAVNHAATRRSGTSNAADSSHIFEKPRNVTASADGSSNS
jgi:hypothetical protein